MACMATVMAVPAGAAPSTGDDPPLQAAGIISISPVQGRNYRVEASVGTLYNSNFRRRVPPEASVRVTPSVSAAIGLPVGRQQFFFGGEIGQDAFIGDSQFNRTRIGVGGGLDWRLGSRCTGEFAGEFNKRQNLVTEVAELVDNAQKTYVVGGSANCRVGSAIGFGGSIVHRNIENDRLQRRLFDVRTTTFSPQISYASPALGQFSIGGSFNKVRYPNRVVPTVDGNFSDGVDIMSVRAGFQRAIGVRLQLGLGASYIKANPTPTTQIVLVGGLPFQIDREGYSGSGYDGSLSYRPSPRLGVTVSANRSVNSSPNVGALFVVNQAYGLDFDYKVGPSITAGAGATLNKRNYRGGFASPDEPQQRISDKSTRIYGQLSYSPVPLYSVAFEVAHQDRKSNPSVFDFKNTTALLKFRVRLGRG